MHSKTTAAMIATAKTQEMETTAISHPLMVPPELDSSAAGHEKFDGCGNEDKELWTSFVGDDDDDDDDGDDESDDVDENVEKKDQIGLD